MKASRRAFALSLCLISPTRAAQTCICVSVEISLFFRPWLYFCQKKKRIKAGGGVECEYKSYVRYSSHEKRMCVRNFQALSFLSILTTTWISTNNHFPGQWRKSIWLFLLTLGIHSDKKNESLTRCWWHSWHSFYGEKIHFIAGCCCCCCVGTLSWVGQIWRTRFRLKTFVRLCKLRNQLY